MFAFLARISRKLYIPLGWTIITQILLSIPGSLFQGSGFLRIPQLDKIAHLGLFGGLMLFWSLYTIYRNKAVHHRQLLLILLIISIYGVAVEFFQFHFIPNRSFDLGDIAADICGALLGYLATVIIIRKAGITVTQN
jgi:hypothetical protein